MSDFDREPTKEEMKKMDLEVKKIEININLAEILYYKIKEARFSILERLRVDVLINKNIFYEPFSSLPIMDCYLRGVRESTEWDSLPRDMLKTLIKSVREPWWKEIYIKYLEDDKNKTEELYDKLKDKWTPSFENFSEENYKLLKELIGIKD